MNLSVFGERKSTEMQLRDEVRQLAALMKSAITEIQDHLEVNQNMENRHEF